MPHKKSAKATECVDSGDAKARRAFHQQRERPEASGVRAREAEEQVQRLWQQWHLPAWEAEEHTCKECGGSGICAALPAREAEA